MLALVSSMAICCLSLPFYFMPYDSIYIVIYCPYRFIILYPLFAYLFLFMFYFIFILTHFVSWESFLPRSICALPWGCYTTWTKERNRDLFSFHVKTRVVEHFERDGVPQNGGNGLDLANLGGLA
jgi:hypothetical protein